MADAHFGTLSLYARHGGRKYLNAAERDRFLRATKKAPADVRLFGRLIACTGSRISEALAVTPNAIDLDEAVVIFETLKRRKRGIMRQVPLPPDLVRDLDKTFSVRVRQRDVELADQRLWPWSRSTAWRYVKRLMAYAEVRGPAATPKGLRHAFGIAAFRSAVPPHLVQRWLGHASLETTAIYGDVAGPEERELASRFWPMLRPIRTVRRKKNTTRSAKVSPNER
jgi:integrase/recombinase XerD